MRCLIVNGDDFGASRGVNRGILEAHRAGILTSASLLVSGPCSAEAAELSRDAPGMSVGLHVDLRDPLDARHRPDRLQQELRAQLARFEALMGRPPTHLDSHHNVHRDARALPAFLDLARRHALPLREHSPVRYLSKFYGQWGGETHLEQIGTESLTRLLATEIEDGVTELSCHPGYLDPDHVTSYAIEREVELRTLCDPSIRRVLAERSIALASYRDVAGVLAGPIT